MGHLGYNCSYSPLTLTYRMWFKNGKSCSRYGAHLCTILYNTVHLGYKWSLQLLSTESLTLTYSVWFKNGKSCSRNGAHLCIIYHGTPWLYLRLLSSDHHLQCMILKRLNCPLITQKRIHSFLKLMCSLLKNYKQNIGVYSDQTEFSKG